MCTAEWFMCQSYRISRGHAHLWPHIIIIIWLLFRDIIGRPRRIASQHCCGTASSRREMEKIKTRIKLKHERRTWSRAHSGHCREPVVAGGFLWRIIYILLQRRYCIIRTSDGVYTYTDRARTWNLTLTTKSMLRNSVGGEPLAIHRHFVIKGLLILQVSLIRCYR